MDDVYCTECGAKVAGSAAFCPKCGTKLDDHKEDDTEIYCDVCGKKLINGVCINCNSSSSKIPRSLIIIILGYLLAGFSGLALIGIFGMICGVYLIYKGHKDLFKRKLNKTNVNGIAICLLSLIGLISHADYKTHLLFAFIVFIAVNLLKTDDDEYYDLTGKSKYVLLIVGIVLGLILILSISSSISHEIYDYNVRTGWNDTSYLEGGTYDTNINGLTFHIPNGFKETDRASDSNSEIALFEDDDDHSFKIYASTSGMTPNHGDVQGSSPKTFGGVDGEMTFYANKFNDKVAGKERVTSTATCFAYKTNGQVVEIDVSHCNDEVLNILIDN